MTAPTLPETLRALAERVPGLRKNSVPHGKITMLSGWWNTPERGTGISSPVGVYADSAPTANLHTSPSGEVATMDVIFTPEFQKRFWAKVDKREPDECWEWQASLQQGYGRLILQGKSLRAHRVAYFLTKGEPEAGLVLDHLCRNRRCVNPAHLEAVSSAENVARGEAPTAVNARKTACSKGHEFTQENTAMRNGRRQCRTCHRARAKQYRPKILAKKQEGRRGNIPFGFVSSLELRQICNVGRRQIHSWCRNGAPFIKLPVIRHKGTNFFHIPTLLTWLKSQERASRNLSINKIERKLPELIQLANKGDSKHQLAWKEI